MARKAPSGSARSTPSTPRVPFGYVSVRPERAREAMGGYGSRRSEPVLGSTASPDAATLEVRMFRAGRPAPSRTRFPGSLVSMLVLIACLLPGVARAAWDRNGAPLATGPADQIDPLFLPDAHGSGHVVWLEPSTSRIFHRYASAFSFPFEGHTETPPSLVFDGDGEAVQ